MVAAALGGSLVTLLLVPDRLPAAAPAGVAFHRPLFVRPGGGRPPGAARRFAMPAQPPGQVYAGPGGRKVLGPATVMPGCQFAGPSGLWPGGPARFRLGRPPMIHRTALLPGKRGPRIQEVRPRIQIVRPRIQIVRPPMMKRIVVLPGKRGPRIEIVSPPEMRRMAIWRSGRPGARRVGEWTITKRGGGGIVQWTSPGGGAGQWTAPGGAFFVGPGNIVAAPLGGPGCVIYSRVGPAGAPSFGR